MTGPSRRTRWFLAAGLLVTLAVAVLLSPYASDSPDGLETVARSEEIDEAAEDHPLADSPLADYGVEGVDDDRLSTGLAGLAGVLLTFGVGAALFGFVGRRPTDRPGPRPGERTTAA